MPAWFLAADGGALLWIQETLRWVVLNPMVILYTHLGDVGMLWIAVSLAMLAFRSTRRAGCLSLCALLLGMLCTNVVLKHLVARPRPWLTVEGLIPLIAEGDPNSFPSGHSCAAFAAAGVWARALPCRWGKCLSLGLAAAMALSRLYVGVHFPSDVLAGSCIGFLCSQIIWVLWTRFSEKKYNSAA